LNRQADSATPCGTSPLALEPAKPGEVKVDLDALDLDIFGQLIRMDPSDEVLICIAGT
jgi:hypothetical protein